MTDVGNMPSQEELESLFVNNGELHRVETYLNRFNPIKTMRMEGMEIRHSAILAWLLDPRETHGFNDKFLRAFLCEAMRGHSGLGSPTALEISQADLRDAEVRREWQNIDIFILLPRLNWAFIIENKFYSNQHEGQLAKYAERVRSLFEPQEGALKVRGVFLTLHDEDPQDDSYAPIQYGAICDILPSLMETEAEIVREDVAVFVKHYLEVIREATGVSDELREMEVLARELYRSHKKVLDFVIEHGATTDFVMAIEALTGHDPEYGDEFKVADRKFTFNFHNNVQFSFLPSTWIKDLGGDETEWEGCENWWAGYPLICWCQIFPEAEGSAGRLRLFAEVGPIADHEFRRDLIEAISDAGLKNVKFQRGAAELGKKYSKFLKKADVHVADIQNSEEIERGIRLLLQKFEAVIVGVSPILKQFVDYGATENE